MRDLSMQYDAMEFTSNTDDATRYTHTQSFDEIMEKLELCMSKI